MNEEKQKKWMILMLPTRLLGMSNQTEVPDGFLLRLQMAMKF